MQPLLVTAGTRIFSAGDPSRAVYVIEDGEVSVTVNDGIEVARLYPGALFGESGVLEARPRAATATAVIATNLLVTDAEMFLHAFGMDNQHALTLVKLLCQRLRSTTLRSAQLSQMTSSQTDQATIRLLPHLAIHLLADDPHLAADYGMSSPVEIGHLPFQVGNRYGGETIPVASNHGYCIAARGNRDLGAPHFEIIRRDGRVGVHDMGTPAGTIVNGTLLARTSLNAFAPLRLGDNTVVAGHKGSPFRFRLHFPGE